MTPGADGLTGKQTHMKPPEGEEGRAPPPCPHLPASVFQNRVGRIEPPSSGGRPCLLLKWTGFFEPSSSSFCPVTRDSWQGGRAGRQWAGNELSQACHVQGTLLTPPSRDLLSNSPRPHPAPYVTEKVTAQHYVTHDTPWAAELSLGCGTLGTSLTFPVWNTWLVTVRASRTRVL